MVRHNVIRRDREILGGTPVFAGTRVPVQTCWTIWKVVSRCQSSWTTFRRWNAIKPLRSSNSSNTSY